MSVMDCAASLRWCLDIDSTRGAKIGDFLLFAERLCDVVAVCGWFSLTSPDALRSAVLGLVHPERTIVYSGEGKLGIVWECSSLGDFLNELKKRRT